LGVDVIRHAKAAVFDAHLDRSRHRRAISK
jgi:hypothetical protein